jgi:hypothetical protein
MVAFQLRQRAFEDDGLSKNAMYTAMRPEYMCWIERSFAGCSAMLLVVGSGNGHKEWPPVPIFTQKPENGAAQQSQPHQANDPTSSTT